MRFSPVPLAKLLRDMMSYASTALDLGFYALAFRDSSASYEVVQIERFVESLWERAVVEATLAARGVEDALEMVSVFRLLDSLLRVTDAAGDLAGLVIRGVEPPSLLRYALLTGAEVTAPLRISKPLRVGELEEAGVDVVAVRRGGEWLLNPGDDTVLREGDVAIVRGSPENVARVTGLKVEARFERSEVVEETLRLKKLADILLDLGFYSLLYGDDNIAIHVLEIEHRLDDDMLYYYELVSKLGLSPQQEYALHKFAETVEIVSDAAASMASMVRSRKPVHRVIAVAENQSMERVFALRYEGPSGVRLRDTGLAREEAVIIAIRRGERWIPTPSPETILEKGDLVIIKTYAEDVDELLKEARAAGFRPVAASAGLVEGA